MKKRIVAAGVACLLILCMLCGCEAQGFSFYEEPATAILKEAALFPVLAEKADNQHIAVADGYYVDMSSGVSVYPIGEATAVAPVPCTKVAAGEYLSCAFYGGYMLLCCKDEPLRYIDLSGQKAPVRFEKVSPSEEAVLSAMQLCEGGAYILYAAGSAAKEQEAAAPVTYTLLYLDTQTGDTATLLTATGTAQSGTVITAIDADGAEIYVYTTEDGTEHLRRYDKTGALLSEHPPLPVCMMSEVRMLGEVVCTEWIDGRIYVMREKGVQVYAPNAEGAYDSLTFSMFTAEYQGVSDTYLWFWHRLSRAVYTIHRQTGEIRTYRLNLSGEKLFTPTQSELLFDDSGCVMLRCQYDVSPTGNRLFMFRLPMTEDAVSAE